MKKGTELIAYCGLHCGECPSHTGAIADLARDLRKELRRTRFDKVVEALTETPFFKELKNYRECYEVLGVMVRFRCKRGCRKGGGNPYCKIRRCCERKGLDGCWECEDFESCEKLEVMRTAHGDACIKNVRRIKRNGPTAFLKGKRDWYVKPAS